MPGHDSATIAADFYESSAGPSVLMEASSADDIGLLLSAVERVARARPGAVEQLVGTLVTPSESVSAFELRNLAESPAVNLRRDGAEFIWEQTTDGWLDTAELIAPLLERPGHQYFADGPGNHAFIEVSVGEHHGLSQVGSG